MITTTATDGSVGTMADRSQCRMWDGKPQSQPSDIDAAPALRVALPGASHD